MSPADMEPTVRDNGFTVLFESPTAVVDLIFVHGLTGHPRDTWTFKGTDDDSDSETEKREKRDQISHLRRLKNFVYDQKGNADPQDTSTETKRQGLFWPYKLLRNDLPNSRVLTYGYDSSMRHRLQTPLNTSTILDYGQNLLNNLEPLCRQSLRPIVFISHSLGGIIVKEALRRSFGHKEFQPEYHRIYELTKALIFFGTPHRGADPRSLVRTTVERALRIAGFQINENLVSGLLPSSERLKELRDEFSKMVRLRDWKVVEDTSSSFDDVTFEIVQEILANHIKMTKFQGAEDTEYIKTRDAISRLASMATPASSITTES